MEPMVIGSKVYVKHASAFIAGAGADILRLKGEMYNTERGDLK